MNKPPKIKYHCYYCDQTWDTEEQAKLCAKYPSDIFKAGDIIDWGTYQYGMVRSVDDKPIIGFSAYKNKDYCIAMGFSMRDVYGNCGDGVYYAGRICGGKERHNRLLFPQEKIDKLVKDLDKRLKAAKRLQISVKKMWENRETGEENG